ncbi:DUF4396 domain-containing protein [Aeromicrobium sp. CF4.19]|uniref:DUF4396 domain-containing protein n=1 Tax=Aeromicrobium sp. CF4.19 TaxID=3373082 RepID=UPI003EE60D46
MELDGQDPCIVTMANNVPGWMTPVAWIFIGSALISAVLIALDIYGRGRRHETVASELVWISSALYLGPFALPLYARHGRQRDGWLGHGAPTGGAQASPTLQGLPGGAASALAHVVGVPLVLASGLTIAGIDLWVMILVIGALAILILFGFERSAASSRGRRMGIGAAAGAAVLTVLAFDVGMGGWMVLLHYNEYMPPASEGTFWFLMQVGVILGLVTGYPVVSWLARRNRAATMA